MENKNILLQNLAFKNFTGIETQKETGQPKSLDNQIDDSNVDVDSQIFMLNLAAS